MRDEEAVWGTSVSVSQSRLMVKQQTAEEGVWALTSKLFTGVNSKNAETEEPVWLTYWPLAG